MRSLEFDVIVVGCGIAGLSAAVSAAEGGARVAVLERATPEERGGNTRYTEAFLRMKNAQEVADDFEHHFAENAGGYLDPSLVDASAARYETWPPLLRSMGFADPELISTFAGGVPPTIEWLQGLGIRFDFLPTPFLTRNSPKMMPIGGGLALIDTLAARAVTGGVTFFYETAAHDLIRDADGSVIGVSAMTRGSGRAEFRGGAVVLASGGFEGNQEMLTRYLGPQALFLRPVAKGGYYNKGEGIRMALRINAAPCGDYGNYHAEPIDPRSGMTEPAIFIFPYGILVDQDGQRFTDEAIGTVDATYERITRQIPHRRNGIAYAILDAKVREIPNYRVAIRSDQPAIESSDLGDLAGKLGIAPDALQMTVSAFNAACRAGDSVPDRLDGLCTAGIKPPKSNWARPIDKPPFFAYPIVAANVFTFGGLKVNNRAQVLNTDGDAIAGLYAAGEVVGIYYKAYTGATSVLKGAVFGRLAGADAAERTRAAR